MAGDNTCSTCKWWSKEPLPSPVPGVAEHVCLRSKFTSHGCYGMDGKAIITAPSFGCNAYNKNIDG